MAEHFALTTRVGGTLVGTIFKKKITRALPAGAQISSRKGKQIAKWTDRKKRQRTAEVIIAKDGAARIREDASTYTAKYRDGSGIIREVPTGCSDLQAARAVLQELMTQADRVRAKIITPGEVEISKHADAPLTEHIETFLEYQRQKKTHRHRIKAYDTRLHESAIGCRFRFLRDLCSDTLEQWLAEQVDGERNNVGFGLQRLRGSLDGLW